MLTFKKNTPLTVWAQVITFSALIEIGRQSLRWLSLKSLAIVHLKFIADFLGNFASKGIPYTTYNRLGLLVITIIALFICGFLFKKKKNITNLLTRKIKWKAIFQGFAIGTTISLLIIIVAFQTHTIYLIKTFSLQAFYALLIYLCIYLLNDYAEEIVFRGYIMEHFTSIYNIHTACFLQAFIFGLAHLGGFSILSELSSFINAFWGGMLLGYIALYTKSFYGSIAAHLAINGFGTYLNTLIKVAQKKYPMVKIGYSVPLHYYGFIGTIILIYLVHTQKKAMNTKIIHKS